MRATASNKWTADDRGCIQECSPVGEPARGANGARRHTHFSRSLTECVAGRTRKGFVTRGSCLEKAREAIKLAGNKRMRTYMNQKHIRRRGNHTTPEARAQSQQDSMHSLAIAHELKWWQQRREEIEKEFALRQELSRKANQERRYNELLLVLIMLLGAAIAAWTHLKS